MTTSAQTFDVYKAIAAVSLDLSKEGIAKDRKNDQQGYKFRGIDDVYNALAPIIAKHGLVILPRILTRTVTERTTAKGGVLFYVVVEAEFDFVAASDGSRHVVRTYGEAMDSADKATNKAMSAAYKYAAFQTFCIPTEGDHDADATTHQIVATAPAGYEDWVLRLEAAVPKGTAVLQSVFQEDTAKAFRYFLAATNPASLERMKADAAKIATKPEAVKASA